ncbi:MAG TPA: galactonate dehydratase [Thermoguttaceae bacterium]|nr:galactonate dehydratase [Thermoguttaceae bacterium]
MKITDLKTYVVHCYRTNWVFIKIGTDEGISGVGEATLEMKEKAVEAAVLELKDYLLDKDPREIERHFHVMYRDSYWRTGPVLMSALSAVEMALWDISAKELRVPVYRLLGGKCNDRVRAYANAWFAGAKTPDAFAERAKAAVARGFQALKWDPFGSAHMNISTKELDDALAIVGTVRNAVGSAVDLLIEGHGRFNVPAACTIARELEPFRPLFFEEPIPPDNLDALADVRAKSRISIAAGERLYHRCRFRELLEKRAADVIQPDVSHAGGLSECRKIAAMAEVYQLPFAPHNPCGPIANAATLQLAACTPNFYLLETMATDVPWRKDLTTESLVFQDGYFEIPDRPGLGIELNEEAFADHPYQPRPLRHYRGDLTDIRPPEAAPYF